METMECVILKYSNWNFNNSTKLSKRQNSSAQISNMQKIQKKCSLTRYRQDSRICNLSHSHAFSPLSQMQSKWSESLCSYGFTARVLSPPSQWLRAFAATLGLHLSLRLSKGRRFFAPLHSRLCTHHHPPGILGVRCRVAPREKASNASRGTDVSSSGSLRLLLPAGPQMGQRRHQQWSSAVSSAFPQLLHPLRDAQSSVYSLVTRAARRADYRCSELFRRRSGRDLR